MTMATLFQDVRYAVRRMARTPGFTLAAVTTLALAIGADTAMFSIVYGVLLRPLAYKGSERLVRPSEEHPGGTPLMRDAVLSNLTFEAWSREPRTIDGLAAYAGRTYTVSILGESQRLQGAAVSLARAGRSRGYERGATHDAPCQCDVDVRPGRSRGGARA
jgi:putative ABC transport system permease protein